MDKTDLLILRALQQNARLTTKELAAKVHLSTTPVFERVRKMEREGIISAYTTVLNAEKLNRGFVVFCQVKLNRLGRDIAHNFAQTIAAMLLSVTLPALVPIIDVKLIMRMGHIMGEGHQKTILLYNEMTWEVSDIVSSYVYRRGLKNNDYSFGAAVDLFNSLVNVIILCAANYFSKHVVKESLW